MKTGRKTGGPGTFKRGHDPRRGHGKKGRSGRKSADYWARLKKLVPRALETLEAGMQDDAPWEVRVRSARDVLDRYYGRPPQSVELTGKDGGAIPVKIVNEFAR